MKYSFSTLGCPDWSWAEITSTAKDLGYDGIELRGLGKELYAPDIREFGSDRLAETLAGLKAMDLSISCLTSESRLFLDDRDYVAEACAYVDLAQKLGAGCIRVLGDAGVTPSDIIDDDKVISRLSVVCSYAEGKNIFICLETNGVYANSDRIVKVIEKVDHPSAGILWDIQHPYRVYGESVDETFSKIRNYIRHVHLKDSALEDGNVKYKMLGYGDLPFKEALSKLKEADFDGYVSFEWVKRWNAELESGGVVFAQFINAVKSLQL